MTTPTRGQRLKAWRCAHNIPLTVLAERLGIAPYTLECIEGGQIPLAASLAAQIDALLTPDVDAMVQAVAAAVRAGVDRGVTQVTIVHPGSECRGRMTIIVGDEWSDTE